MKRILMMLVGLVALLGFAQASNATSAKAKQPMAVLIAADWCGNCKLLEPKLQEASRDFEDKIQFVSFDVTDEKAWFKSKQEAYVLGVPKLLNGKLAVGWVALFDRNGNQVGKLMQDMSVQDMHKALQALATTQG